MATTLPYATPYTRSAPRAQEVAGPVGTLARVALACVAGALVIAMLQLWLAGQATATITANVELEGQNSILQAQYDRLLAQDEELRSPTRIETDALRLHLEPITQIEYGP
jgi:hypothetical protein